MVLQGPVDEEFGLSEAVLRTENGDNKVVVTINKGDQTLTGMLSPAGFDTFETGDLTEQLVGG